LFEIYVITTPFKFLSNFLASISSVVIALTEIFKDSTSVSFLTSVLKVLVKTFFYAEIFSIIYVIFKFSYFTGLPEISGTNEGKIGC